MGNRFQDLIPAQGGGAAPVPVRPRANRFSDLIPGQARQTVAAKQSPVPQRDQIYDGPTVMGGGKGDIDMPAGQVATSTYVDDMLRSGASGIRGGLEMMAGTFGDLQQVSGNLAAGAAGYLGASPEMQGMAREAARRVALGPMGFATPMPTTAQIEGATNKVVGQKHSPHTMAGEYAKTIGEFAPSAVMGPGGLVRKTAMTLAPAMASETAGQITKGTDAEPYARIAGAILGGGLAAGSKGRTTAKMLKQEAKSTEELIKTGRDAYAAADQQMSKVRIGTKELGQLVRLMNAEGAKLGFGGALGKTIEAQHAQSSGALKEITGVFVNVAKGNTPPPTIADLERFRQTLGQIARDSRNTMGQITADGRMAQQLQSHIDDVVKATPYKEARQAYLTRRKVERVEHAIEMAAQRASSEEQAIKNEFRKIVRENKKSRLFDKAELAYINRVANHTSASNIVESLGRMGFGPRSTFAGTSAATGAGLLGSAALGPVGGLAVGAGTALVTSAAKKIGAKMTAGRAEVARNFAATGKSAALNRRLAAEGQKRLARRAIVLDQSSRTSGE